jgi:hypothetical protein
MRSVIYLEPYVVQRSNLTFKSYSHYSNHGHMGMVKQEDAGNWMSSMEPPDRDGLITSRWRTDYLPQFNSNPVAFQQALAGSCSLVRNRRVLPAPSSELPKVLRADQDARLNVSIHYDSPEFQERLMSNLALVRDCNEHCCIRVEYYQSYKNWTRRYTGCEAAMVPFTGGAPCRSWEHCPAKTCKQLFEPTISLALGTSHYASFRVAIQTEDA